MKSLFTLALSALLGLGSFAAASAQQYPYPGQYPGQYGQQNGQYGHYGQNGHNGRRRHRNRNCNNSYGTSYGYGNNGYSRNGNDNDNDNDGDNDGNRGNGYGYGNAANCNGAYGQNGNAVVRGTIVSVNGNMVTLSNNQNGQSGQYGQYGQNGQYGQYGQNGPTVTINDQPALDSRTTGRVSIGRFVTAFGYWQNGTFYATRLQ